MLEKILIPVDSIKWENTLNSVKTAIEISQGCNVNGEPELIFLHVSNVKPRVPMSERERLAKMKREKIEEEFETVEEMCNEKGVSEFSTITKNGNPVNVIINTAEKENVDMIVIGSGKLHDKSPVGKIHKFFYGSITEEVIRRIPCSIIVTRSDLNLRKILVPIDSIEWDYTMNAVDISMRLLNACSAGGPPSLTFMHVPQPEIEMPSEVEKESFEMEKERIKDEFYMIEKMAKGRGLKNVETFIKEREIEKSIAEGIIETAGEKDADLLVVGSGKLHDLSASGRIKKFFYGSITEEIIHKAPCSVLIAKPIN